jgi:hypothetical protein
MSRHIRVAVGALFLLAVSANAATLPANPHDKTQVETYIRACEDEWAATEVTLDSAPARRFIAPDYHGVSSRGKVVDFAEVTADDAGPSNFVSDKVDYTHFHWYADNLVIVQGHETGILKDGTRRPLLWIDVWMLRKGKWQIIASQDSVVGE